MSRKLALIIGSSEYDDETISGLAKPEADVNSLVDVLRDKSIGGFDETMPLLNESSDTVRKEIAKFFARKNRDDLLLLYFSGHGVLDDQGQLYLALKDSEKDLLSATAIPANYITQEMDRSYSRRQVLILDCCHSGAFARGTKGVVGASVGTAMAFEGTGAGRVVLTASDSTQYAWEGNEAIGEAQNSVFTHYLIQGLSTGEADLDTDGVITLDELYDYVHRKVVTEAPKQTPHKWSYRQEGDVVIARNPKPVGPAELSAEIQHLIESPLASSRESAVSELDRLLRGNNRSLALAAEQALRRLKDDDSRNVSSMVSDLLARFDGESALADTRDAAEVPEPADPVENTDEVELPAPAVPVEKTDEAEQPAPEKEIEADIRPVEPAEVPVKAEEPPAPFPSFPRTVTDAPPGYPSTSAGEPGEPYYWKALLWHLFLGRGLFYASPKSKRKSLYTIVFAFVILSLLVQFTPFGYYLRGPLYFVFIYRFLELGILVYLAGFVDTIATIWFQRRRP